jgi:hypothetical protein
MATAPGAGAGSALPIEAFCEDAQRLQTAAFEARHGSAFLLLTAAGHAMRNGPAATHVSLLGDSDPSAHTANLSVLVYPVRPGERAAGHLLTLGRAPNNDVVIPDHTISRFHAFLKRDASGGFLIQDAGSTNGTSVNGAPVAAKDLGPATALKRGDTLRLGQLEFTFVDAIGMRAFAGEKRR